MTSQLNVDTIVDKAGSGGSNVKMANTSTYVSDGGNVTQNTVQSLLKAWVRIDGTGTAAIDDSFNCGSLTDNGTGDYSVTRTNNMSSAATYYVIDGQYLNSGHTGGAWWDGTTTTATVQYKVFDGISTSSAADRDPVGYAVIGDLA